DAHSAAPEKSLRRAISEAGILPSSKSKLTILRSVLPNSYIATAFLLPLSYADSIKYRIDVNIRERYNQPSALT
ncbi:MAG TPA: hypothetical protein PLM89_11570, partial [Anaerolineales bacterium]|nr:hypothetical protein [Anaerolineales bacterium]